MNTTESNTTEDNSKGNVKRLYWWALLSFIPIIGVITGLILLLRGIFKYRNKGLILVGIFCIVFSASIHTYLVYNFKYGNNVGKRFVPLSKFQLNELVKQVEFYKIQNGSYPDSLQQLQNDTIIVMIADPLLVRRKKGDIYYRYQKVGEKYKLYSVGIDGLDGTADDFYPTLSMPDSTKIGLIR